MPICWIIAGPNGAGKTTFALKYLPGVARCSRFVNADLIAAGLSPLAPERELLAASRLFLNELEACIRQREDFAFETTLAGRAYLKLITRLRAEGWRVELLYLALPSVETSRLRVAERVAHGGHDIPATDIERRFPRSLANLLNVFSHQVDTCRCFMNSGTAPELVFEQHGESRNVTHTAHYQLLQHLLQEIAS
jgi:predicted ABC-type ATPase